MVYLVKIDKHDLYNLVVVKDALLNIYGLNNKLKRTIE